jgi:hypothetical protein
MTVWQTLMWSALSALSAWITFGIGCAVERGKINQWRLDPNRNALVQICLLYLQYGDRPDVAKLMYQRAQATMIEIPEQWWTQYPQSKRQPWAGIRDMGPPLRPDASDAARFAPSDK